ncbi:carbohydrate ABC transporter permease [Ilumatobacter nonamiensis]|uniref:carbohydrate ABC transporter permease n=1 Tax=Ilumatobacter nonamiensis TaxID=467093 RepID=UPI00034D2194|nr:carbohydrate ABC transporter permease [Ilumatobacter nonamiensis]
MTDVRVPAPAPGTAASDGDEASKPPAWGHRTHAWDEPHGWRRFGRYALLVVITVAVLFPVYTTVVSAFKPSDKFLVNPLVPDSFTLDVIREAWTSGNLGRYLFNSTVVAIAITTAQVVTSLLSGYAFAYLRFPGRKIVFYAFLATLLVPLEATVFVNFQTIESGLTLPFSLPLIGDHIPFGGLNSFQALIVPFLATAFGTFLMRQALLDLPSDLREAARLDGIGHLGFIRHVAVPLVRPTLAALALFTFLSAWNQYLWPSLIINEADANTVQSGLRVLSKSNLDQPNLVMAGTVIAAIPILIVLIIFQKQLVRGLTAGAVKG